MQPLDRCLRVSMHWVARRWLVKCRPWWIHSCWKRIRTACFICQVHLHLVFFLTWNRAKIRPKSPVATRYGYVNVTDMKAMANLASFLTLEPDVVSKEMKVCPRPLASLLYVTMLCVLTWFPSAQVTFAWYIQKTVGWIATPVQTGCDRIVRPKQLHESKGCRNSSISFQTFGIMFAYRSLIESTL